MNAVFDHVLRNTKRAQRSLFDLDPPHIERRRLLLYAWLGALDLVLLAGGYLAFGALYFGDFPAEPALMLLRVILPVYAVIALYQGVYSIGAISDWRFAAKQVIVALGITLALTLLLIFYAKVAANFSRLTFTVGSLLGLMGVLGARRFVVAQVRVRFGPEAMNILVVNDGGPDPAINTRFRVESRALDLRPDRTDNAMISAFGELVRRMDRVVVSTTAQREVEWAGFLRIAGIEGEILTERMRDLYPLALRIEEANTFVLVAKGSLGVRQRIVKRAFDVGMSLSALTILAPLMLVLAACIRVQDAGPVMFRQRRVGKNNRVFQVYKFRSMRADRADAEGVRSTERCDPRVTPIGRFMRRTSLDELPQLFNVLKGEMSIVGPRPHALGSRVGNRAFWEVDPGYWYRHSLKPGITGLAQVRGFRGATDVEQDLTDRLSADLEYLQNWSLLRDIRIVLETSGALLHDKAY